MALCTIVAHNIAQNRPDNFPPYPPDNHHRSNDVYLREGGPSMGKRDVIHKYIMYRIIVEHSHKFGHVGFEIREWTLE